jgi:hypothetical protein
MTYDTYLQTEQDYREAIANDQLNAYINGQSDGRDLNKIEDYSTPYLQEYAEEAKIKCEKLQSEIDYWQKEINEIKKIIYRNLGRIEKLQEPQEFVEF